MSRTVRTFTPEMCTARARREGAAASTSGEICSPATSLNWRSSTSACCATPSGAPPLAGAASRSFRRFPGITRSGTERTELKFAEGVARDPLGAPRVLLGGSFGTRYRLRPQIVAALADLPQRPIHRFLDEVAIVRGLAFDNGEEAFKL